MTNIKRITPCAGSGLRALLFAIGFLWIIFMLFFAPKRSDLVIKDFMSLGEIMKYDVIHSKGRLEGLSKRSLRRGRLGKFFLCIKEYGKYDYSLRTRGLGTAVLELENGMQLFLYSNENEVNMFYVYDSSSNGSRKYSVSCNIGLLNK